MIREEVEAIQQPITLSNWDKGLDPNATFATKAGQFTTALGNTVNNYYTDAKNYAMEHPYAVGIPGGAIALTAAGLALNRLRNRNRQ